MSPFLERMSSVSRSTSGLGLVVLLAWQGVPSARVDILSVPRDIPAKIHRIEARDLAFQPPHLEVARGDTVVWVNRDIVPHTVTAADSGWDSGEVPPGGRFRRVINGSGALRYVCRYHPGMTGTLRRAPVR